MNEMNGVFVYKTDKNKTVYFDWFSKDAHYIGQKEYKVINTFQLCLPLCVLVMYVLNSKLKVDLGISAFVSVFLLVVAKILFNVLYINNLPIAKNFKRPKRSLMKDYLSKLTDFRLGLITILLIVFGILTYIGAKQNFSGIYLIFNYILIFFAFVGAAITLFALIQRKTGKDK